MQSEEQRKEKWGKMNTLFLFHINNINICIRGLPGEERTERKVMIKMLKGIMAEISSNLLKNINTLIRVTQWNSSMMNSKRNHKQTHYIKNIKIQRQGGNLESNERKVTHHLHRNPNKINNWISIKNNAGQKADVTYSRYSKNRMKSPLSSKLSFKSDIWHFQINKSYQNLLLDPPDRKYQEKFLRLKACDASHLNPYQKKSEKCW